MTGRILPDLAGHVSHLLAAPLPSVHHFPRLPVNMDPTHKDFVMLASCMNDRARAASAEYALASRLATEWTHNQADVYALDEEDLIRTWISTQQASGFSDEQVFARFEELTGDPSLTLGEHGFEFVNLYAATAINAGRDRLSGAPDTRCPTRPSLKWE